MTDKLRDELITYQSSSRSKCNQCEYVKPWRKGCGYKYPKDFLCLRDIDRIISLFKQAGWKSPEECDACADGFISTSDSVEKRAAWAKANGWVGLSDNQELPKIPDFQYDKPEDIPLLQRGAINYSKLLSRWKKVKEGYDETE